MKRYVLSISTVAILAAVVRADDVIPKRSDFNRYEGMVEKSPFAVASAPVQTAVVAAWSKDLFIANALHMDDVDLVTVNSLSDKNMREYLTTEGPNDHGYGISSIEWSENPGATKVTISKDGQFATIGFNEAIMAQMPSVPNVQPPQPAKYPGAPQPAAGGGAQPMPVQPANMPPPHVRGVIQRRPQAPGQNGQPVQTPAVPLNAAPVNPPES